MRNTKVSTIVSLSFLALLIFTTALLITLNRPGREVVTSAGQFTVCSPSSQCITESECYSGNGTAGATCDATGRVCCTAPLPAGFNALVTSRGSAANNCCNTPGYADCRSSNLNQRYGLYEQGFYDCQANACSACQDASKGKFEGISAGDFVSGSISVKYEADKAKVSRIEFYVDSTYAGRENSYPYYLGGDIGGSPRGYNISDLPSGKHYISVEVFLRDGSQYKDSISFNIAGSSAPAPTPISTPKPKTPSPTPAPAGSFRGITNGETIAGKVNIEYLADRSMTLRIEYFIDNRLVHTESWHPYYLGGDEGLDKPRGYNVDYLAGNDLHTLLVKVYPRNGGTPYQDSVTFRVGVKQETRLIGIKEGDTLSGSVAIQYLGDSAYTQRVEFYMDGQLVHTESGYPYYLGGDLGIGRPRGYNLNRHASGEHILRVNVIPRNSGSAYEESVRFTIQ